MSELQAVKLELARSMWEVRVATRDAAWEALAEAVVAEQEAREEWARARDAALVEEDKP